MGEAGDQRAHKRKPIRLRVSYKSAQSLVTEYTTSISKGACAIETRKRLPEGTRFTFELYALGNTVALQVEGRVVRSEPEGETGLYRTVVEYLPTGSDRAALDAALDSLLHEQRYEKERRHPRVPVNLVVQDGKDSSLIYLMKDLSVGGAGLQVAKDRQLPAWISIHAPVSVEITMDPEVRAAIEGEVVWTVEGRRGFTHPRVGIAFGTLTEAQEAILKPLLRLHRPSQILLTFGD